MAPISKGLIPQGSLVGPTKPLPGLGSFLQGPGPRGMSRDRSQSLDSLTASGMSSVQHQPAFSGQATGHQGLSPGNHGLSPSYHAPGNHGVSPSHHAAAVALHGLMTGQSGPLPGVVQFKSDSSAELPCYALLEQAVSPQQSEVEGQRYNHEESPYKDHKIVYTIDKKYKPCVFCQINKKKTKSGWYAYSYYKCDVCDIPLCKGTRDCFNRYHRFLSANKDLGGFNIPKFRLDSYQSAQHDH